MNTKRTNNYLKSTRKLKRQLEKERKKKRDWTEGRKETKGKGREEGNSMGKQGASVQTANSQSNKTNHGIKDEHCKQSK